MAREYVRWLASRGLIRAARIAKYLHKGVDIDLVAVDEEAKTLHAFEVKWATLTCREAERIASSLEKEAPGGGGAPRLHALRDMPFEKPSQSDARRLEATPA